MQRVARKGRRKGELPAGEHQLAEGHPRGREGEQPAVELHLPESGPAHDPVQPGPHHPDEHQGEAPAQENHRRHPRQEPRAKPKCHASGIEQTIQRLQHFRLPPAKSKQR